MLYPLDVSVVSKGCRYPVVADDVVVVAADVADFPMVIESPKAIRRNDVVIVVVVAVYSAAWLVACV